MSDAILLLHLEHGSMFKVLRLIEEQLERTERGLMLDRDLLLLALDYLSGFSDECHHPKENLIYRKIKERDAQAAAGLNDLLQEHADLEESTARLARLVRQGWTQRDVLSSRLGGFLGTYRRHMLSEEREFFPVASQTLSPGDLAELDFALLDRPDPLVDRHAEERFRRLREEIERLADAQQGEDDAAAEVSRLREVSTVEQFNDSMSVEGHRLVALDSGYAIETGSVRVAHIPPCSEARAAWCAYFFLRGRATSCPG